jgi:autotransporter family porin
VRRTGTAPKRYDALAAAFDTPPRETPLDPPEPPLDPLEPPEPPEPLLDPPPLDPADPPDDDAPELESLESLDLLDESLDLLDESLLDELSAFALASAGFSGFDDA